jgi:nucleotide-binding universal stress UspA family protein
VEQTLTDRPMDTRTLRLERVLCAVTFSRGARQVVAWAASLAAATDAEVRLFHVVPQSDASAAESGSEQVLRKLFALGHDLPGRPRISAAVTEGDAAHEVLRHARLVKADLIVVGMHAQDGSVSGLVTRLAVGAPCPVLAVDERSKPPRRGGGFERVVVGVNFLPASLAAADYAFALARTFGAEVTTVHVLPEHWDGPPRQDPNLDEARQLVEHHFRLMLRIAAGAGPGPMRDGSDVVTSGRPCAEIVRVANARDADLVVLGIDARSAATDRFGETASCVMQFAGRSVLLVPERLFAVPRNARVNRAS